VGDYLSAAEAARRAGYPARALADLIYRGGLDVSNWPVAAGRRVVPIASLPAIKAALQRDRRFGSRVGKNTIKV
jgi:hypothetical protein